MRSSRTLLIVTLLCMTSSIRLIADEQEATVREQVLQERSEALERLSHLRHRMDKIQLQLEQLDIEKVVKQRLQQGAKLSVTDELNALTASAFPSELDQSDSSLGRLSSLPDPSRVISPPVLQAEVQSPFDDQSSFSGATVDMSNLTSRAFELKRRFVRSQTTLSNKEKLFKQRIIASVELELAAKEFDLATDELDGFQLQISTAIPTREKLLESLSQERALIERQFENALAMHRSGRGSYEAAVNANRELLQFDRQVTKARDSLAQLRELAETVKDRDEEAASPEPPATSETTPAER